MKITGIKTNIFSSEHRNAKRNWLVLRLTTDEGIEGIGEASMLGHDPLVARLLEEWVEAYLVGKSPLHHELHWVRMFHDNVGRGGRMFSTALSGIDLALWDLKGKALGVPVYELLGGPFQDRIRVYANGWYTNPGTPEQNAEESLKVVAMGYTAMKFDPFGQHNYYTLSPEEAQLAVDRVAAVREAVGPNVDILVEVHAKFNVYTAVQIGKRLEEYRPFWFEEPVSYENVSEMAQVRSRVNIPIATGERLYLKFPFHELMKAEAVDILQPDMCNAGGITELKKIAAIAESQHVLMAPHNTNAAVGTVASFHLDASLPNFLIQEYHAEFYEPHYFEVFDGLPRQTDGYVDLPKGPGLGLTFNEEVAAGPSIPASTAWTERYLRYHSPMRILGIETSCDETAAAVIEDGRVVLSNVVASQAGIHAVFGGIVPEVASRQHLVTIVTVLRQALEDAKIGLGRLDGIAVTHGPGLAGSLLIGVNAAKGLALAEDLPFIGVNHLEGHVYAAWLEETDPELDPGFPLICLITSGGHTDLILMEGHGRFTLVGRTRDDAGGEAFDKAARVLGLGFPGGPAIQEVSALSTGEEPKFTRPHVRDSLDFSFSGLKTALVRRAEERGIYPPKQGAEPDPQQVANIAAAFQEAIVDSMVRRTLEAAKRYKVNGVLLGGGVAANSLLRKEMFEHSPVDVVIPRPGLCTDNGAMIGAAGYFHLRDGAHHQWGLDIVPNLKLG